MTDTSARLLSLLLSLLQTPRGWPGMELAERLGVSPRTIHLRQLGARINRAAAKSACQYPS